MELIKALTLSLGELEEPIITRYRLGVILHFLYLTKTFKGESLKRLGKDYATSTEFNNSVMQLTGIGVLKNHPNFPGKGYALLGHKDTNVNEIACCIDPFCYISHLSAMSHHGLTNRLPMKLFITGPDQNQWRQEAEKQMAKDLGDKLQIYKDGNMPILSRPKMHTIERIEIHRHNSIHRGAYRNVSGKTLRVSTIGQTFLDMLRTPNLCGGMSHIIDVWVEHAQTYISAIISELDQHGAPIDKVRAGYILGEKMNIQNETIDSWVKYATRGGSRKLDASAEYLPQWSEKWCLSINI